MSTVAAAPVVVGVDGSDASATGLGADGSLHSACALGFAFERAQDRGLALTAVRAWRSLAIYVAGQLRRCPLVTQVGAAREGGAGTAVGGPAPWREQYPDVDVVERTVLGNPGQVLLDASAGAEILVVGSTAGVASAGSCSAR